jgi:hypothetical protein
VLSLNRKNRSFLFVDIAVTHREPLLKMAQQGEMMKNDGETYMGLVVFQWI